MFEISKRLILLVSVASLVGCAGNKSEDKKSDNNPQPPRPGVEKLKFSPRPGDKLTQAEKQLFLQTFEGYLKAKNFVIGDYVYIARGAQENKKRAPKIVLDLLPRIFAACDVSQPAERPSLGSQPQLGVDYPFATSGSISPTSQSSCPVSDSLVVKNVLRFERITSATDFAGSYSENSQTITQFSPGPLRDESRALVFDSNINLQAQISVAPNAQVQRVKLNEQDNWTDISSTTLRFDSDLESLKVQAENYNELVMHIKVVLGLKTYVISVHNIANGGSLTQEIFLNGELLKQNLTQTLSFQLNDLIDHKTMGLESLVSGI